MAQKALHLGLEKARAKIFETCQRHHLSVPERSLSNWRRESVGGVRLVAVKLDGALCHALAAGKSLLKEDGVGWPGTRDGAHGWDVRLMATVSRQEILR